MTWAAWLAALGLVLTATPPQPRPVFEIDDPAITESSGLVDLGRRMVTMNDSGGEAVLYVLDSRTGRTVATTRYADEVRDVEALAPAGDGEVWVGDIGDNAGVRSEVRVYRVPAGDSNRSLRAPSYALVYPDGPHDAESLVVGRDGRLRIITKSFLGGRVYVAPRTLDPDRPNRLRAGAPVDVIATDAALFPDGRHVLVRGYNGASVFTFPAFRPLGRVDLPVQEQGEGVSIGSTGRIRVSSEGSRSQVWQVPLPPDVRAAMAPTEPAASPSPGAGLDEDGVVDGDHAGGLDWRWVAGTLGVGLLLGWLTTRRSRR